MRYLILFVGSVFSLGFGNSAYAAFSKDVSELDFWAPTANGNEFEVYAVREFSLKNGKRALVASMDRGPKSESRALDPKTARVLSDDEAQRVEAFLERAVSKVQTKSGPNFDGAILSSVACGPEAGKFVFSLKGPGLPGTTASCERVSLASREMVASIRACMSDKKRKTLAQVNAGAK